MSIPATPLTPQLYVVNLTTGKTTGGPTPPNVQHYHRDTGELTIHEYAPTDCDRCSELHDMGFSS